MSGDYVWVKIGPGDTWLPGYEKVAEWGGWTGSSRKVDANILAEMTRAGGAEAYLKRAGYPSTGGWFKAQFDDGVYSEDYERLWFCIPPELHDEVFGPKFNEWGEISP